MTGKWVDLPKINGTTHIHLKEGKIIPYQRVNILNGQNRTRDWEKTMTSLVIQPDSSRYAEGYMLIDDGKS